MTKKLFQVCLCCFVLLMALCGCEKEEVEPSKPTGKVSYEYFDTVSYVYNYANDPVEKLDYYADEVFKILSEYHQLFDIYHEYEGVTNLCTINKKAGDEPLVVDQKLIEFLKYAKELYYQTNGQMNVMLGSVLQLWHNARETASANADNAYIPSDEELQTASLYTSIELLEIDEENSTVRISDANASIDVGALGKGYATEVAAQWMYQQEAYGYVLNIGGNIRTIGTKPDGSSWSTAIRDPNNSGSYIRRISISDTACVTSGNYERYFVYEGQKYHHIIDSDTLMPSVWFASVTIITEDSGLADALSTALFCMSYEDGLALINSLDQKVDVLWIDQQGNMKCTDGFEKLIIKD